MAKKIIVYDNGGKTFDRYTVFVPSEAHSGYYDIYVMSGNADSPQGVNQYVTGWGSLEPTPGASLVASDGLGKRLDKVPDGVLRGLKARGINYE